ncbi:MAG: tryptophan synthase alpha chain [Gammaproteobacteria bacterium]|jgi:tryptophan synthase alpha chain
MSRIGPHLSALRREGRKALIPYVSAGDPSAQTTLSLMHAMVEAGADVIELGVPFSDPMADGPVIQRGGERALAAGMTVLGVLDIVSAFRADDDITPVVLMGYLNPIERMGHVTFAQRAANAGVDGVLTVDLPPEEGASLLEAFDAHGIDPIFLLSPTTTNARIATICQHARGYVYYVSLKGVTGSANIDVDALGEKVKVIRSLTDLPIGVGFGIADAVSAQRVAQIADAVVVGTALVRRVEACVDTPEKINANVCELLGAMRTAMNGS